MIGTLRSVRSCRSNIASSAHDTGLLSRSDSEIGERGSPPRSSLRSRSGFGSRRKTLTIILNRRSFDIIQLTRSMRPSEYRPTGYFYCRTIRILRNTGGVNRRVGPTQDRRHTTLQTSLYNAPYLLSPAIHGYIDGQYEGVIATA